MIPAVLSLSPAVLSALLAVPLASAGDWKEQEIDPRYETDFTAYTIEPGRVRLGLVNMDVGVFDNISLGTAPALFLLAPNAHTKITFLSEGTFDMALTAGIVRFSSKEYGVTAMSYPLGVQASWMVNPRWSLHGGLRVENIEASGSFGIEDLGGALDGVFGVDVTDELTAAMEDAGSVYGGAHLTMGQGRIATDLRLNRRDSIIYQYQGYFHLSARIDAGYATEQENVQVGVSGKVRMPLEDEAIGTHTVSWQFSWLHWHLRAGIGWSRSAFKNPLQAFTQGWELYYLFGKPAAMRPPPYQPYQPPADPAPVDPAPAEPSGSSPG